MISRKALVNTPSGFASPNRLERLHRHRDEIIHLLRRFPSMTELQWKVLANLSHIERAIATRLETIQAAAAE